MELFPGFSCHVSTNPRSHVCTIFQFCVSNPRSYDGMWKSLKVTPQRNQPGISHFIQTTEDSVCCLSFTRGTVKQMARRQHGSKMNWVSGWVLTCLRTSECMWEFMYTVQFVRWGRRAATAGSGRFWSSGCQNPQPRHVRRRWERVPAGRTAGLLRCWCRRGRSRCHRTPGIQTEEAPSSVSFAVFGIMSARCAYSWLTLKTHAWIKNPKKMQQGVIILLLDVEARCFELTCILLLPQSATMMFPLTSTATPVGALNWPLPSPFEPNFSKNSPSVLNTCIVVMAWRQ